MGGRRTGLVAAPLIVLALSGCESFARGPAAVTWVGEDLVLASCVPMNLTEVFGEYRNEEGHVTFLDAQGAHPLAEEQTLALEQLPEGMAGVSRDVPREGLRSVVVRLTGDDIEFAAGFDGPRLASLRSDQWLQTDGQYTDDPCGESRNDSGPALG